MSLQKIFIDLTKDDDKISLDVYSIEVVTKPAHEAYPTWILTSGGHTILVDQSPDEVFDIINARMNEVAEWSN